MCVFVCVCVPFALCVSSVNRSTMSSSRHHSLSSLDNGKRAQQSQVMDIYAFIPCMFIAQHLNRCQYFDPGSFTFCDEAQGSVYRQPLCAMHEAFLVRRRYLPSKVYETSLKLPPTYSDNYPKIHWKLPHHYTVMMIIICRFPKRS